MRSHRPGPLPQNLPSRTAISGVTGAVSARILCRCWRVTPSFFAIVITGSPIAGSTSSRNTSPTVYRSSRLLPDHDRPPNIAYISCVKTKSPTQALEHVEKWPAQWQDQLAEIAFDIDAGLKDGVYHPSREELEGIDRDLRDAEQSRFATEEEVEAAFAKFRGK